MQVGVICSDQAMVSDTENLKSRELINELHALRAALQDAEERLSLTTDACSAIGSWDWHISEGKVRVSPKLAEICGIDPETGAQGAPLEAYLDAIHPDDRERVEIRLRESMAPDGVFTEEFRLLHPDGSVIWLSAHGRCHMDESGQPVRHHGIAIDIAEQKASDGRKSALLELGERLRERETIEGIALASAEIMAGVLGATRAGFGIVDEARETVMLQPDWRTPGVPSLAGLHRFRDYGSFIDDLKRGDLVLIGDVTKDSRTRDHADKLLNIGIRVLVNVPILERGRFVLVLFVHYDSPHRWTEQEIRFVRTVADRTQVAIGRLRAEQQRNILHRELGHRIKNNLTMVQSIVQLTLRNVPDLETARTTLSERLAALGRSHELLVSNPIAAGDMHAVIANALAGFDDDGARVRIHGPALELDPTATLYLAMMLHELATNATKYGALSMPDGLVDLHWRIVDTDRQETLQLTWQERNGPAIEPPVRQGLGTRLIQQSIAAGMSGKVRLDFPADGAVCSLTAPLEAIKSKG